MSEVSYFDRQMAERKAEREQQSQSGETFDYGTVANGLTKIYGDAGATGKVGTAAQMPWFLVIAGVVMCFTPMIGLAIFAFAGAAFLFVCSAVTQRGLDMINATPPDRVEITKAAGIGCSGLLIVIFLGAIALIMLLGALGEMGLMKGVTGF